MKRANNEGSIFQLGDGRWRAQISIGGGKYRTRTFAKQEDAVKGLRAMNRDRDATGIVARGDLTVADLIEEWRTTEQVDSTRTTETIRKNGSHLRAWSAAIGTRRVGGARGLTVRDVTAAMVAMSAGRKRPLSYGTLLLRKSLLNQVFEAAMVRGDITWNPVPHATIPPDAPRTDTRRSFTAEQANAIISATESQRNGAAFLVGLALGLRPGELFGLTWRAIDFRRGTIHIHQSVGREHSRSVLRDSLKNSGSLRTLVAPAFVLDALRLHGERQDAEIRPEGWTENDLVFPDKYGRPTHLELFRVRFRSTVAALGFGDDWTPNEMRHTAASLLADHGVSLDDIAQILGHKTTRMVEIHYRHVLRPERSAHVAPMEDMLAPRRRAKKNSA